MTAMFKESHVGCWRYKTPALHQRLRSHVTFILPLGVLIALCGTSVKSDYRRFERPEESEFIDTILATNLNKVLDVAFIPGNRMLVVGKRCEICLMVLTENPQRCTSYLRLEGCYNRAERGLLGFELDPEFNSSRPFIYIFATFSTSPFSRVIRFRHVENVGSHSSVADPESGTLLWADSTSGNDACCHYGGALTFGPEGYLYLATGDKMNPISAQELLSPNGKIHKIDHKSDTVSSHFVWASGLRNPFRMSYDNLTNVLYIGDVGSNDHRTAWEEINVASGPGKNFGWPLCEGPCIYAQSRSCQCSDGEHISPHAAYRHAGQPSSIIGGFVYRSNYIQSYPKEEFDGAYFYADFVRRRIMYSHPTQPQELREFQRISGQPVSIRQAPDGSIVYVTWDGSVRRLSVSSNDRISQYQMTAQFVTLFMLTCVNCYPKNLQYHRDDYPPIIATFEANHSAAFSDVPVVVLFTTTVILSPGDTVRYSWDFGDGRLGYSNTSSIVHEYRSSGR